MNSKSLNYKITPFVIKIVNIKKKILYQKKNISLLCFLEVNDIKIDYQCRSGYCGICRIQLIRGYITYSIKKPIAAVSEKNQIFPCCCKPNGNITIKI